VAHQGTSEASAIGTMRSPRRSTDEPSRRTLATSPVVPWVLGAALAAVLLGPALAPGAMFNLDLVLTPASPVPRGVWGLGPELPRRVPIWLVVAWLAPVLGGDTVAKVLMAACIVVAFVGAHRLTVGAVRSGFGGAPGAPGWPATVAGAAAGLLYASNPFLLTRLAIGHLMIAIPMAVLPWVVRRLLRPGDDLPRTFLALLALSLAGHYGGTVAGIVVLVGLAMTRGRNLFRVVGLTALAQLSWLVPGLVVYLQGVSMADATPFSMIDPSAADVARVLGGHGFYDPSYQVGHPGGMPVLVAGALLLALAVYGTRALPDGLGPSLAIVAGIGFLIAISTAVPGLSTVSVWMSRTAVGSVLREGQRALPLYLVWMAPAAALGAHRLATARAATPTAARAAWLALPLVLATVLALPGVWGLDADLRPVSIPADWEATRAAIRADPGPVLALPWHQYLDLGVAAPADGAARRTLNPMPIYLGGDVMTSSDPELQEPDRRERLDPRERHVLEQLDAARAGRPVATALAELGIRWVLVQHDMDWRRYEALARDPGLRQVVAGERVDLFAVTPWAGLVTDAAGAPVPSTPIVDPLLRVDPSGPATYARPFATGWLRGLSAASESPQGTIALPAGSGPVWYWPSVLVLASYAITVVAAAIAVRRIRRHPDATRARDARDAPVTRTTASDPPAPA
jgi:hypothetical protein